MSLNVASDAAFWVWVVIVFLRGMGWLPNRDAYLLSASCFGIMTFIDWFLPEHGTIGVDGAYMIVYLVLWWRAGGGGGTRRRLRALKEKFKAVRRTAPVTA